MANVGRKSKGDRHTFVSRVPRQAAEQVIAEAGSRGMSYSDFIAAVLCERYGCENEVPLTDVTPESDRLPLTG